MYIFLGNTVALKVVKNNNHSRERNALNLCHENIVTIINIIDNDTDGYKMVIMEYYQQSVQLQRIIEDSDMNLDDRIIDFSIDISKGLQYCHKNNILHLDIKPSNILLCNIKCKICDFGNSVSEEDVRNGFKYNVFTLKLLYDLNKCSVFFRVLLNMQHLKYYLVIDQLKNVIFIPLE